MTGERQLIAPMDEHNRALIRAVHPPDWQNPKPGGRYNLVVIGGGTAGLVSAMGAAGLGAKVALIERHLLGGDCLNVGCVPSKGLLSAAAAARARGESGEEHFVEAMRWVRESRARIAPHDSAARFRDAGVDVYLGEARFTGPRTVTVAGESLEFGRAVVATGGRAAIPPIDGLAGAEPLTNDTVFELEQLPAQLAIIGAGPIGCELAQAFQRLGSRVTLFDRSPRVLPRDDARAAQIIAARLEHEGVRLELDASIERVDSARGTRRIHFRTGDSEPTVVEAARILVAAGRKPNVEGLGLESAGVEWNERGVVVDGKLRTTNRRIFAAGDVAGTWQFTHAADAMARMVLRNAFFFGRARAADLVVPWATYTDPEVAHVGVGATEAAERGLSSISVELSDVDRAIVEDDTDGYAVAHYDRKGRILGATVVGRGAGDVIGSLSMAMSTGTTLGDISGAIFPYPTRGEVVKKLGDAYARTRLTPGVKSVFEKWFAFLRR